MYLLAHNAHLIKIERPGVPADPAKGIGGGSTIRWQGDVQAYIDQDTSEVVKGGHGPGRVIVGGQGSNFIIDLPVNLPCWPDMNDLVTLKRMDATEPASTYRPVQSTYAVRMIDGGLTFLGKVRIYVVMSA